jgi:acyl-homoserine lactone acylase PvdQ
VATAVAGAASASAVTPLAASGAAPDYCLSQCNDILPPGENGTATAAQILANKITGAKPAHTDDQLGKYSSLVDGYTGLTNDTLGSYFDDSSFGVPANQVESTLKPGGRSDVTIVRDTTGIPHITGTTRDGTEYGAGYAAGQDRLWMMDVFRHIGRGQLSGFAGGAEANRQLEQQFYLNGAATESDLQAQVDSLGKQGARGAQAVTDVTSYLNGLNRYIADSKSGLYFPGEYDLTGNANILTGDGIQPFKPTDLVAIGSVVGALFGAGGGNQVASALVKVAAEQKYGVAKGDAVWQSFRQENDPEATTTLHTGQTFPYAASPANPQGVALPDPGSVTPQQVVFDPTGTAAAAGSAAAKQAAATPKSATANANAQANPQLDKAKGTMSQGVLPADMFAQKHGMSNALVVSGQYTDTGNPVAVFGPQTGYFAPQLLMLEEIQGPGISARGAAFAGLNFYVQLGRGQDYAWSATSASQDIIDTFAVSLCNVDGTPPTKESTGYLYNGACTPMDQVERDDAWSPTVADGTGAGSYKLIAFRTKYGIVQSRATVGGKPVAYTTLRSTYNHDIDTVIGFQMFNDPAAVTSPQTFQQAASNVTYTFNWFYVDSKHTAYYNSGLNPTRAPNVDPNLPITASAANQWRNWDPDTNTVANTPYAAHPNSVDQDYYVSWNNKIANGYSMSTFGDGSVYRSNLLDSRVKAMVASGKKVTRASLAQAMEDAAVTDLRGEDVLPKLLQVLTSTPVTDPAETTAITELKTWLANGAKRKETAPGSKAYADSDAIRIMDAWWPLLVKAEFGPNMGDGLYTAMTAAQQVDEAPSSPEAGVTHKGSSFQLGWWSYVDRDLRSVLGQTVQGGPGQTYCGAGDLAQCRASLLTALSAAVATPATTTYPADSVCSAGDQWCSDSIQQHPLGGISDAESNWQNRPTYQQVVQFPAHRGDNVANLALNRPVTATSYQSGFLQPNVPPSQAVDGDITSRWGSSKTDNESITVDLGAVQPVGRAVLYWESAYGKSYKLQVSDDGTAWRDVYTTSAGNGGQDVDVFPATNARFVRMQGVQRGTGYGYSLYEFEAYAK